VSIALENIRLMAPGPDANRPLFDGLSLRIGADSRVGILGTSRPVNSALLRLICGTKVPEDGIVRRDGRVSWPIPLSSFLVAGHTLARNVRFIARLYGIADEEFPRRIAETVELTEFVNTPLGKCPKFAKSRLAFALGIGIDFDIYLFDGSFAPVDKPFKQKAAEISSARTAGRGVVVATSVPAEVEQNCESVYVLEGGRATYFEVASQGVEHFKQLLAMEKGKDKGGAGMREVSDDEDEGLGDVDMLGAAVADALD
jgi:capsular polysaccharide transport system ATP-binding protein